MASYPFTDIETKWQAYWDAHGTFRLPDTLDTSKPKYYVLDMFPYPSGSGLHVGHPEGYTATDIVARYKRMKGFNVLHPIGWDAFGLPAEQYAIETGTHPRDTTRKNIGRFREQLKMLGFSYDWSREVDTTDPRYYKWTQWIFQKLYEKGLAYVDEVPVNWCPALGTVLANEEIVDGKSERGAHPVYRIPMRQWMLKITAYADRLLEDLDLVQWPPSTLEMQKNWIGRSEGAEVDFKIMAHPEARIRVFTTRLDTLFGATYMVLAPEHPLVKQVTTAEHRAEVEAYVEKATLKSDLERQELQKEKTGVFTGAFVRNPVNDEHLPIWIADYVLASYGTGAIMAVPAHDERDFAFAQQFGLPIREVVAGGEKDADGYLTAAYTGNGPHVQSSSEGRKLEISNDGISIDGLETDAAKTKIIAWLEDQGVGRRQVNYRLRDWVFSRQRYWGEPFPVVFADEHPHLVPEADLPVVLPEVENYRPSGTMEGPLATVPEWVQTTLPDGTPATRETNTMPQWAGSCWYYLRYLDPDNDTRLVDPEKEQYWMPVDLYVGGAEHAVLHLLYARFWHKVLYDLGIVSTPEPFGRLVHQGMILGEYEYTAYQTENGTYIPADRIEERQEAAGTVYYAPGKVEVRQVRLSDAEVEKEGDYFVVKGQPGARVVARAHKMSKSRGNVVNPDEIVDAYGADSMRLYEMFMGPLEQTKPWSTRGVEGVHRFLNRAWRLLVEEETGKATTAHEEPNKDQLRAIHYLIQKVTDDVEGLRFNTAIAAMMEFVNAANRWEHVPHETARSFVLLLSPFAPHVAEELWQKLGHDTSIAYAAWPEADPEHLRLDVVTIAVQVNGKVRASIDVAPDAPREQVLAEAKAQENVQRFLEGTTLRKEVYVPGRIVNLVAS